tara:strand:- start:2068 stop:2322 length:255 start_codon:yes stop_codon:yes gene_type:complete
MISDKPFLYGYASEFKVGDLVRWRSFDQNENYETIITEFAGAIIEIKEIKHFETGRFVCYAVILPFGQTRTMEVPVHILKKQTI